MARPRHTSLRAPFLKSIAPVPERVQNATPYALSIPALAARPLERALSRPITIFVGTNGCGKSTLLEAIASLCGFGRFGGNRNYAHPDHDEETLGQYLRGGWLPKVTKGFYTRAETRMGFIRHRSWRFRAPPSCI